MVTYETNKGQPCGNPPNNGDTDRQKEIEALAAIQLPKEERTCGMTKHLIFLEAQILHLNLHEKPIFNGEFLFLHGNQKPVTYVRRYNTAEIRRGWFKQLSVSEILCLRYARETYNQVTGTSPNGREPSPDQKYEMFLKRFPELRELLKNNQPGGQQRQTSVISNHWLVPKLQPRDGAIPDIPAIINQALEYQKARKQIVTWFPQRTGTTAEKQTLFIETLRHANNPEDSGALMDAMIRKWPEETLQLLEKWEEPKRDSWAYLLFLERAALYLTGGTKPGSRDIIREAFTTAESDLENQPEKEELLQTLREIRDEVRPAFKTEFTEDPPTNCVLFSGKCEPGNSSKKKKGKSKGHNNHQRHPGGYHQPPHLAAWRQ